MASPASLPYHGPPYQPSLHADSFEDFSRQWAMTEALRRSSRGPNGQRPGAGAGTGTGTAMRIVKPSSANSSPRSHMPLYKRRTLLNEGNVACLGQHLVDQHIISPMAPPHDFRPEPSPRPVSWHPASSQIPQLSMQSQLPHYQPQAQPNMTTRPRHVDMFSRYHNMSPTTTSYSCNTSPSTFSPLTLPLDVFNTQPPFSHESWNLAPQPTPSYSSPGLESRLSHTESCPAPSSAATDGSRSSCSMDWNSFVMHGFSRASPATPENLPQLQEPKTAVAEELIPYQPLLEQSNEDDGEILVGMGLYDAPDKGTADLGLNNSRSALSSLLGSSRGVQVSPGKGLKLEETWEPPESDDDDDEDDEPEA